MPMHDKIINEFKNIVGRHTGMAPSRRWFQLKYSWTRGTAKNSWKCSKIDTHGNTRETWLELSGT